MKTTAAPYRACARATLARVALGAALAAGFLHDAHAVFTFTAFGSPRRIIMQVGSANTTVNNVTFNVTNATLFLNPTPVTGVPGNGTPATTPANGTEIRVTTRIPTNTGGRQVILSVNSSAGLTCVGGSGCGTTVIPFSTIRWTSYNKDTAFPGFDIQDGAFNGSATQQLTNFSVTGGSVTMSNVLIFEYDNATLYPFGQYTGRVTYTASMP